ncbi:MAG: hypothetical protein KGK34_13035 [Chloroflexota bacterium]|nr:hypothetical protein [Chloroflexota bacterium]
MRLGALLAPAVLLATGAAASANMGNPFTAGAPVGEPTGLEQVAIEHEVLEIDLRSLAQGQSARIAATYSLRNDGAARSVPLVFVAPALDKAAAAPVVSLDGAPVPVSSVAAVSAPPSWTAPPTTPGLGAHDSITYVVGETSGLRFDLPLSPGSHTVSVAYAATAARAALSDSPLVYWQLAYVLAPARQWASFGGMDVRVTLPSGWSAAATPALGRSGDTLTGAFRDVPADALGLTVQAHIPEAANTGPLIAVAIAALTLVVAWIAGSWLGSRRRSSWWSLPLTLAGGAAWAVAAGFALYPPSVDVPGQASYTYGYGASFTVAVLAPFAFFIGWAAMQVDARIASGRARRRLPAA